MKPIEPIKLTRNQHDALTFIVEAESVKDLNVAYDLAQETGLEPDDLISINESGYWTLDSFYLLKAQRFVTYATQGD